MRINKMGFETPEEVWLKEQNPDYFRSEIAKTIELSNGIVTSDALSMLERVINGSESFSFTPWRLISFGRWLEVFSVELD